MSTENLSQTPAAIASRKRRADAKKTKTKTKDKNENLPSGPDDPAAVTPEPSTATIGVQTPGPAGGQAYHCNNCDEDVTVGMAACPTCEQSLNWPAGI